MSYVSTRPTLKSTAIVVAAAAFLVGAGLAVQAQLNGMLTERTGSAVLVTLVSFTMNVVILLPIVVARRQVPSLAAVRSWQWRRWWLLGGPLGAFLVVAISAGVPILGVALATVLTVAGQTVTGIMLDAGGTGVGQRIRLSGARMAAVVVAVAGLAVTVIAVPSGGSLGGVGLAFMIMLLVAAGVASALQQSANGAIAGVSGNPAFAALVSSIGGVVVLTAAAGFLWVVNPPAGRWPSVTDEWWLYTGGLFGTLFIVVAAWAVRKIGVLALGLAVVAGQIVAAVALDVLTGSAVVGPATILSIIAVVIAVVLAVVPSRAALDRRTEKETIHAND